MTTAPADPHQFDERYRDAHTAHGLPSATPWDVGGPQPAVLRLAALGAIGGEVLDQGTGPGYHAIHLAARGHSVTGTDVSPAALQRARRNAEDAGVEVRFELADARTLTGVEDRFDTVLDCAFYHTFAADDEPQLDYARVLHRVTRPGARLFLFTFGQHTINGFAMPRALSAQHFDRLLEPTGWRIDYLGPTSYRVHFSVAAFEQMAQRNPALADRIGPILERFRIIEPWLADGIAEAPFWEVHATRLD
ncbi:class I SAM-dependent methyltransferase [Mycolicibacillus parakoreensis]|uniref:Class I SAM-dependent methyltransferase n=1 Tax=Mycolicibacillus parakoreensis TaxID=1069221 RepID=A0ABY3TV03_9MYCO|nr:class I SAM-dependent methyltransferase [Mycolicibacillus parakoreensis]MCV7317241.1 class I SAM-dependent methyltransferase [Mycolicibacillus parakoreensis]ULN51547.1 class I SAM-dependent methyltransferase [Mycolicibacillus parakoreensis]HLR99324.1 class I SAM-dependent methyltransferase [Mycolicibacillus parakoreensis]